MKIVSFGSINFDHVYTVPHIVRPGETISCTSYQQFLGGKGLNQGIALKKAEADAYLAAQISESDAALPARLQSEYGVPPDLIEACPFPTGHAVIQVDRTGQNCIFIYPGANASVTLDFIDRTLSYFQKGDCVLLQNEIALVPEIIRRASERGLTVALNPSPFTDEILNWPLQLVDIFILNEIECAAFSGETEPEKMAEAMLQKYPHCKVVLTLGKNGVLYRDGQTTLRHGVYDVPVVDTTAAGDTFTGFFLAEYMKSRDAANALSLASAASSIAVSRKGAAPSIPRLDEVLAFRERQ